MQLVNEKDDVLGAADFVHDRFDTLLKLAAILCAGDHQREIERDDLLVAQKLRHLAGDDFLGEALGDGGFADAGLTDQDRIVLGAAAKNLDHALDLVGASDDRIELVFLGELREVASKGAQGRCLRILLSSGFSRDAFALFLAE